MDNKKDVLKLETLSPSDDLPAKAKADIDHLSENRLVRKLDFHIIPFVMLLYLFSFLDRYVHF